MGRLPSAIMRMACFLAGLGLVSAAGGLVLGPHKDPWKWNLDPGAFPELCASIETLPECGPFVVEREHALAAGYGCAERLEIPIAEDDRRQALAWASCWFAVNGYLDCKTRACLIVERSWCGDESIVVGLVYPQLAEPLLACLDPLERQDPDALPGFVSGVTTYVSFETRDSQLRWMGGGQRGEEPGPCQREQPLCSSNWFPQLCEPR